MSIARLTGRQLGQYRLLNLLGEGGMSAVYRAYQGSLNREVAIKVLSPQLAVAPGHTERFLLEARTAALLEHGNIVPVYDYGTQDGLAYVVMRLLTGGTLEQRLEYRSSNGEPLPSPGEAALLLREVAEGLSYAHLKGVVHRDIKPGNVMFDAHGTPYITDFGIARIINAGGTLTGVGVTVGTPAYMAPELWRDEGITPAVDQYALGAMMYNVLVDKPPFLALSSHALMYKHLNTEPPPIHELRAGLPERVTAVLERALAKSADDRYPDVKAFSAAFAEAVAGEEGEPTGFFTFPLGTDPMGTTMPSMPPNVVDSTVPPDAQAWAAPQTSQSQSSEPAVSSPPLYAWAGDHPRRSHQENERMLPRVILGGCAGLLAFLIIALALGVVAWPYLFPDRTEALEAQLALTTGVETPTVQDAVAQDPTEAEEGEEALPTPIPLTPPGTAVANANDGAANVMLNGQARELHLEPGVPARGLAVGPGDLLAATYAEGIVLLWQNGSGGSASRLIGHQGIVHAAAFSPDGSLLATMGEDATVRLWDVADGAQRAVLQGHAEPGRAVAFSPDGSLLASGAEDRTIILWDVASGSAAVTLSGHEDRVLDLDFSPDGSLLASAGEEGAIRLWNVQAGAQSGVLTGHGESVRSVAFSPDGTMLASSSTDNTVRVWDVAAGTAVHTFTGHGSDVWCVAFSPDGRMVASGGRDNTVRLGDVASGQELSVLHGHEGWVFGVAFSPDGTQVASAGGDGRVLLWQLTGG